MARFTGDYQGDCTACSEPVELAIGVRTESSPVAMHFGPGGPRDVSIRDMQLAHMMDDRLDVRFEFACPLCGAWSTGRATCAPAGTPGA
jgi:hypothetical protein